jgi:hypothetical protein
MGPFSKERDDVVDVEKTAAIGDMEKTLSSNENGSSDYIPDDGAVHAETFVLGDSWYAKTQRLAGKFGVEQRGIERVPSDERSPAHISQVGTMWLSANMVVSSFAIGALAYPVFFLGFIDTVSRILALLNILSLIYLPDLDHILHQLARYNSRVLLQHFWAPFWIEANGSFKIFFRSKLVCF